MPRIYLYKLATINDGAPCVVDGLLTLGICKPMIRSSARIGDLLIGVAANSLFTDNRLVYVARVTDKLVDGAYFREPRYRSRPDCIYQFAGAKFKAIPSALYHGSQEDLDHDLGLGPRYLRANTLMSREFRYFGTEGTADYRPEFKNFAKVIDRLGRGHRVNHGQAAAREMEEMAERIMAHDCPGTTTKQHEASGCGVSRGNIAAGANRQKRRC